MRVAGMLRVRNEARWIRDVMVAIKPVCPAGMYVLDDHSSDRTALICEQVGACVIPSPFEGLDETRDKNFLLAEVQKVAPDWIACIDGDEVLAPNHADLLRGDLEAAGPEVAAFALRIAFLWNDDHTVRIDGAYQRFLRFGRPSIFRAGAGLQYMSTNGCAAHFHCGNVPRGLTGAQRISRATLLHYGYMLRDDRLRKYHWYNEQDPGNQKYEDCYRHMILGDVPELPTTARLTHGGPLRLEALSAWLDS